MSVCQIMIFTNFKKVTEKGNTINLIADKLLTSNRDGFGYSIQGAKGAFGERTESTEFKSRFYSQRITIADAPFVTPRQNSFGTKSKTTGGALFHGRVCTNTKGLKNTHPINKHGWSLIHNGVISHHGAPYKAITNNDTEHLVELLGTLGSKDGVKAIEKDITGYYAVGAFDPMGNLHVIKDSIAHLHVAYSEDLESFIYATTQDLIETVCDELSIEISHVEEVKDNIHVIFNPAGKLVYNSTISPRGYDRHSAGLAHLSLGHNVEYSPSGPYESWPETKEAFKDMAGRAKDVSKKKEEPALVSEQDLIDPRAEMNGELQDIEAFFYEVENLMDASYNVYDKYDQPMPVRDFHLLEDEEKLQCLVIRGDGTVCSPVNYNETKLAASNR